MLVRGWPENQIQSSIMLLRLWTATEIDGILFSPAVGRIEKGAKGVLAFTARLQPTTLAGRSFLFFRI
jgi:hypothetical protein